MAFRIRQHERGITGRALDQSTVGVLQGLTDGEDDTGRKGPWSDTIIYGTELPTPAGPWSDSITHTEGRRQVKP